MSRWQAYLSQVTVDQDRAGDGILLVLKRGTLHDASGMESAAVYNLPTTASEVLLRSAAPDKAEPFVCANRFVRSNHCSA